MKRKQDINPGDHVLIKADEYGPRLVKVEDYATSITGERLWEVSDPEDPGFSAMIPESNVFERRKTVVTS